MRHSRSKGEPTTRVRTVDLFCGCGGLALGFELHAGQVAFETVLGVDIEPAALRTFNANFQRAGGRLPTGRRTDLSWFNHRSEVLLYFLVHYAAWAPDAQLETSLRALKVPEFLASIREEDEDFRRRGALLAASKEHVSAWSSVDSQVTSLAIFKGVLTTLGLASLRSLEPSPAALPWAEEYETSAGETTLPRPVVHRNIALATAETWDTAVSRLEDSAGKTGRGQHRTVAGRTASAAAFFRSGPGEALREAWISWRARRDSLRADFCLRVEAELDALYGAGRQVQLVLGGPPCKGWSRIGRAKIESLRNQGVHAWASQEYGDERNALLHKYVLFLDALRPTAFLFENVAHFESSLRTPAGEVHAASILEESINQLASQDLEFHVSSRVVRAKEHGVPQDRERYFMIGIRGNGRSAGWMDEFFSTLPRSEHQVPLSVALMGLDDPGVFDPSNRAACGPSHRVRTYTLVDDSQPRAHRDYLAWINQPDPKTGSRRSEVDGHIVRRARADDEGLFRLMAPGMRWMDYMFEGLPTVAELRTLLQALADFQKTHSEEGLPSARRVQEALSKLDRSLAMRLILEAVDPPSSKNDGHHLLSDSYLAKGSDNHGDWLERLSPDRPCKTITAHIGKDTYGFIHPTQPRALSLREAARVQTFPDFFELGHAGVVDGYGMIGNAVPPLLASLLAGRLEHLHRRFGVFAVDRAMHAEMPVPKNPMVQPAPTPAK